jgi:dipeptidyl-peptidase III
MLATRTKPWTYLVVFTLAFAGCRKAPSQEDAPTAPERRYLVERVGEAAVVQAYADGFESRPLGDKVLMWHLAQAAIAGRDIYYDQISSSSLDMREIVEAILTHPSSTPASTLREIERYTKLFWINNGPYSHLTGQKSVLRTTPAALTEAVRAAISAGASLPLGPGESADTMVSRLGPMFFDPAFAPTATKKTPEKGQDILSASFNNLYKGVALRDLKGFRERYGLNSRLVKTPQGLTEEVYRIGGRYDAPLRQVVTHLEAARNVAGPATARALDALIKWYRTGEESDRRAYDVAWVEDKASAVDTINGFTEVYLDARGVKGSWEAVVFHVNDAKTGAIRTLASNAQWFEDHMPWDPAYRKAGVTGITANAIDVVMEIGNAGPITPVGINLPNDQTVREQHGSKSVSLSNISEAHAKSQPETFRTEFAWTADEGQRSVTWGQTAETLTTNMHEVIGHASGKVNARTGGKPENTIREFYSALEEARADLVALYFIADPKLAELGLMSAADQPEIARTEYEGYTRNALVQLRRVRSGSQLEEDHMRNRQMVVHWLLANTKAIDRRTRDGKTFYVMTDVNAFREGVGRLLAEVQRIKAEGDFAGAKALFETHGIHFDAAVRDEIVKRVDALDLPSYTGFVMPRLEAIRDASGAITDVRISYPLDLKAQMLEFSAQTRATREAFLAAERAKSTP